MTSYPAAGVVAAESNMPMLGPWSEDAAEVGAEGPVALRSTQKSFS